MAGDYDLVCLLAKSGSSLSFLSKEHWQPPQPMRSELASALTAKGIAVPHVDDAKSGYSEDMRAAENDGFDQGFNEADFQQEMLDHDDDFDIEA